MSEPTGRRGVIILTVLAAVILIIGWRVFWFLTDDAFISFRYIGNSLDGHGYVWNPPPFRPVEGYTNFLWMVLLEGMWRVTGITPPVSCNWLSLGFSLGSLSLTAILAARVPLGPALHRYRTPLVGLVLLAVVTNRTTLTWASSGLETALFNFLLLSWVTVAVAVPPTYPRRLLLLAAAAALVTLTRPDGMLLVAATVLLAFLDIRRSGRRLRLAGLVPLLLVPAHVLWRRSFYGEWLPNSYYAKNVGPWPESGWRYAFSFVMEYGLWIWIALAAAFLILALVRKGQAPVDGGEATPQPAGVPPAKGPAHSPTVPVVAACLAAHFLYYTFLIGGDHFEYRVYSHLIPLLFVSLLAMSAITFKHPGISAAILIAAVLVSWPVPYTHFAKSRHLDTRDATFKMRVPVADAWPAPFRGYAEAFDREQAWLIDHYVCMRHQEHKVNLEYLQSFFRPRGQAARIPEGSYPVLIFPAVGYVGWALPEVNILDSHGLNDYVAARKPIAPGTKRAMAHDRQPPKGYVECLSPNVQVSPGRVQITPRAEPLTAEGIRSCETLWADRVTRGNR